MYKKRPQSTVQRNPIEITSSDSDSDDSLEQQTASDVINSFLTPNKTVKRTNVPKSRRASDIINSFLRKSKFVDHANHTQFDSALAVINSFLLKDKFAKNGTSIETSVARKERRKESSDDTSSESDSDLLSRKRKRVTTDSSSNSDSDSDSSTNENVAKKPRIEEKNPSTVRTRNESSHEIVGQQSTCRTDVIPSEETSGSTVSQSGQLELQSAVSPETREPDQDDLVICNRTATQQSTTATTSNSASQKKSPNQQGSSKDSTKAKSNSRPKQKDIPETLKVTFTRELYSMKTKTRRIAEQQTIVKGTKMPKEKFDRALKMLNSADCRYDETPIDYSLPKSDYDVRRCCNGRRHFEATYDTVKLGTSVPVSLTRIILEMDNCLKKEMWQQMAELIYFGCGLMTTEQSRRASGTAFFTYALLLLILDSSSTATIHGKRNEIMKFLIALGSEPDESEEFLKELNLVMDESDTDLLVMKSEKDWL